MKWALVLMCAAMAAATANADVYSTGFEYADQTSMEAGLTSDGWTWNWTPAIETGTVHSGNSALRLPARVMLNRPVNEFGTLNLWVYDAGLVPTETANGTRWGLQKDQEVIAGTLAHRSWLPSDIVYAANPAYATNMAEASWYSYTWVDAGDPADRSRGVAGWTNWEIAYYPDGTIEINLLEDPNYPGTAKAFASNTVGTPALPDATSIAFADPTTGGADALYLYGSRDTTLPFGDLIVDDLSWTPVPEPTTLSLMALAGLAGIRRRR